MSELSETVSKIETLTIDTMVTRQLEMSAPPGVVERKLREDCCRQLAERLFERMSVEMWPSEHHRTYRYSVNIIPTLELMALLRLAGGEVKKK